MEKVGHKMIAKLFVSDKQEGKHERTLPRSGKNDKKKMLILILVYLRKFPGRLSFTNFHSLTIFALFF